jgi:2-desacetyl-2-hydroxyethyl bacteriochlorophyllide A dehydrogenase
MKQAVLETPGSIVFREIPMPEPLKPNEILLRIKKIGVCGSDIHVFHGKHPFVTQYPVIQGHEYSGEVAEIGSAVTLVKAGMKATARPQVVCGHCAPCLRGQYNVCQNLTVQGFVANGSAQEYFVVTEDRIVAVPDKVSYEQAALIEPAAVGAHSTIRAGSLIGKNVVVAGAGTIGNLIAQFAINRGAKKVLLTTAKSDFRLGIAKECGIKETANLSKESFPDAVKRVFGEEGFQVGFEAAGAQGAVTDLIAGVENGGTVIIVGVFEENPVVNMGFLGEHELNVLGSMMYRQEDYEEAVQFIADEKLITSPLITSRFPFNEYLEAYHFIEKQGDKSLKVMIDVAGN